MLYMEEEYTQELLNSFLFWDVKTWSPALNYWDEVLKNKKVENALELGAHKGGLSLWLALKGISVVCSDLDGPSPSAKELHRNHHVEKQIHYQAIDALSIPYENHFDMVIFKSMIGGIARKGKEELKKKLFEEVYKALKPGGILLFAENLKASSVHSAMRKVFVKWGDSWSYQTREDIRSCLQPFANYELHSTGFSSAFGRSEGQRAFLSAMDSYLFLPIIPRSCHYVAYGSAEK